jgi:hypothetical protein
LAALVELTRKESVVLGLLSRDVRLEDLRVERLKGNAQVVLECEQDGTSQRKLHLVIFYPRQRYLTLFFLGKGSDADYVRRLRWSFLFLGKDTRAQKRNDATGKKENDKEVLQRMTYKLSPFE